VIQTSSISWGSFGNTPAAPTPAPAPVPEPVEAMEIEVDDDCLNDGVTVKVTDLTFTYPGTDGQPMRGVDPMISDMSFTLKGGEVCLLTGANGAGKTTLLKLLAGKHMVEKQVVRVLGRPAFHDVDLNTSGLLNYLGGQWRRDIAFAGYDVPLTGDFSARQMLHGVKGVDKARLEELVDVLDINYEWRLHQVSDGQRRRVQIAMGLLKPFRVLLLDEITVDLDVLVRRDLMEWLKKECLARNATVIYATHIFDGLDDWATHVMYVARGKMQLFQRWNDVEGLVEHGIRATVENWLTKEKEIEAKLIAEGKMPRFRAAHELKQNFNNGWAAGRLNTTLAPDRRKPENQDSGPPPEPEGFRQLSKPSTLWQSSNAVMR